MRYKTSGTCSQAIDIEVENGIVQSVTFIGGCSGNLQGISRLVNNMPIDQVIETLKGIKCRGNTSCPDQLAKALEQYQNNVAK